MAERAFGGRRTGKVAFESDCRREILVSGPARPALEGLGDRRRACRQKKRWYRVCSPFTELSVRGRFLCGMRREIREDRTGEPTETNRDRKETARWRRI